MCKNRYYHSELNLKCHDISNRWTFFSALVSEISVNATIKGVWMLFSLCALKTLNRNPNWELYVLHLMPTPAEWLSLDTVSPMSVMKQILPTSMMGSLVSSRPISKHNILIISRDMNAQVGIDENDKFGLHNIPNRKGDYVTDFSLVNNISSLNSKFFNRERELWI